MVTLRPLRFHPDKVYLKCFTMIYKQSFASGCSGRRFNRQENLSYDSPLILNPGFRGGLASMNIEAPIMGNRLMRVKQAHTITFRGLSQSPYPTSIFFP